ncbi:MAG: hypothetical protein EPN73_02175 [Paraburkholderia sp.]|uniref:hypothetical protein n=1 Tax=Paraburkholderia sp. TaxID=1926495 RepID=UPI001228508E|nr:hypothetical protein [Paraburkholderia sp.]TAL98742.1 MAG: hypothetical protein EPN73_02175 [Paraburkholderia sp.]
MPTRKKTPTTEPVEVKVVKGSGKAAPKLKPDIEITTGLTGGNKYYIKINQPTGKSVLVAVHL